MYVGYTARKNGDKLKAWMNKAWPAAFLVWFAFIYTFSSFALVRCDYGKGVVDIAASLCACYCIFFISKRLDRFGGNAVEALAGIGRYSLIILCVHLVEMNLVDWWAVVDRLQVIGIPRLAGCGIAVGTKMVIIFAGTLVIIGLRKRMGKNTGIR